MGVVVVVVVCVFEVSVVVVFFDVVSLDVVSVAVLLVIEIDGDDELLLGEEVQLGSSSIAREYTRHITAKMIIPRSTDPDCLAVALVPAEAPMLLTG